MPPAEDCYKKERDISEKQLYDNHTEHIELLYKNGVDIIWNETFSHLDEIKIVSEYCTFNDIPFVVNLFVDNNLNLLSGERVHDALELLIGFNFLAIGFNCYHNRNFLQCYERI